MVKRPARRLVADRRSSGATARRRAAGEAKPGPRRRAAPRRTGMGLLLWPLRALARAGWALAWRGAVVVALVVAASAAWTYARLPEMASLADGRARGSVTLLDREGRVFAWRGDQFGGIVTTDSVAPVLVRAVVASEDRRFYRHPGVDPIGIASAIRINLREGRGPLSGNGGSTITQQVAKLLCLGQDYDPASGQTEAAFEAECRRGSVWRKVKEIPFALALEAKFTKDEILSVYLNRAYLGAGARGFEAASQRYFGHAAADLDAAEAAMLAGLLPAPSYYAPTGDIERARARAATVLRLMADQGRITDAELAGALARPASLSGAASQDVGGAFADWVVSDGPDFLTTDTTEDVIVRTTLDDAVQRAAEAALAHVFETEVRAGSEAQAAIVVMDADGAVRAMVGGRNTRGAGEFNRATQALRQTGSAFKPFVYAAALDLGYGWNDRVVDAPLAIEVPGSGTYSPENYDRRFRGEVTLTEALMRSLNAATVRVSEAVGRDVVRNVATDFGLTSDLADGPALALGVSESTLLRMTGAYAGILNGGTSVTPYGLTAIRLRGDERPLLDREGGLGERVVAEGAARQLTYMMHRVVEAGTGGRAKLPDGRPAAGKTGTTQAARDAWFVGFTGELVAGVWMGYDDNTPLTGVTGGGLPAEIWREAMTRIHEGRPVVPLPMIDPTREVAAPLPAERVAAPAPRAPAPDGPIERVLMEVLGGLFRNE